MPYQIYKNLYLGCIVDRTPEYEFAVDLCSGLDMCSESEYSISVEDVNNANLLSHFDKVIAFLSDKIENHPTKKVLVFCQAAVSRSPTICIAFLMKVLNQSVSDAIETVRSIKSDIRPNDSFICQLYLYKEMDCKVNFSSKEYLQFENILTNTPCHILDQYLMRLKDRKGKTVDSNFHGLKCRKCRNLIVENRDMIPHYHTERDLVYYSEPLTWMNNSHNLDGKINCPHCNSKLGNFNWSGAPCLCGEYITPFFSIHAQKVDPVFKK